MKHICKLKKSIFALLLAGAAQAHSAQLTTYVTEWGGYSAGYGVDNSYINRYHSLDKVQNSDMVNKFTHNDIVSYAFLQVWNPASPQKPGIVIPNDWAGHLHFDDLWANLPSQIAPEYTAWKRICSSFSTAANNPECSAVQLNGTTQQQTLFDYSRDDVGQMNNFGAFLKLGDSTHVKKVISIGGANTPDNHSVSMYSFAAIFEHQATFIQSLTGWRTQLAKEGYTLDGIDYDFEPPINAEGGQLPPGPATLSDYQHLFELIKATRAALGNNFYISVTITSNKEYLDMINKSVEGGWFKQISPYVNAINLMTYDLHGPWSLSSDPGTLPHIMLKQPEASLLPNPQRYGISYTTTEILDQVLSFGVEAKKIQIGLASYGRGFSGVAPGTSAEYPGFDQSWTGPSKFDPKYTNQDGMLPFKSIPALISSLGYKPYEIKDKAGNVIASYIYNSTTKQFVGYQSIAGVKSTCELIKSSGLQGAIMWSMDTDAEGKESLTQAYDHCQ
jgi:chitinase